MQITTEATGSGAGIAAAEDGSANLGASDAYLSDAAAERGDVVQIPLAIAGQFVAYNLQSPRPLNLSAEVLAGIYRGTITHWNDPQIARLNAGAALPAATIIPLRRSDKSGDTFLFSSYLFAGAPHAWTISPATAIAWPAVNGEGSAKGNRELLELLHSTPNGIAYIGISLYEQTLAQRLGMASLRNHDGAFVAPTKPAIEEAAARVGRVRRDGRVSLIDLPGARTYPIVNVEYAIVRKKQADVAAATPLRAFLSWIVAPSGGNAPEMLDPVHFVPLTAELRAFSRQTIDALR